MYRHRPEGELWLYLRLVLVELREVVARVVAEAMVAVEVSMAAVRVAVEALKAAEVEAEAVRRAEVADKVAAEMVVTVGIPGIDIDSGIGAPPRKTRAPDRRTVRTNRCTA